MIRITSAPTKNPRHGVAQHRLRGRRVSPCSTIELSERHSSEHSVPTVRTAPTTPARSRRQAICAVRPLHASTSAR